MELWKTIGWSLEQEQTIYREWGLYFAKKQVTDVAEFYFDKALNINPNDSKALFPRSQCKRKVARFSAALADATKALEFEDMRQLFNLEVCDVIYQRNEFEETKRLLKNFSRKFSGNKVAPFEQREDVVGVNLFDSLGPTLGHFIIHKRKIIEKAYKQTMRLRQVDYRPMWKILKEKEQCDTLSVLEEEEVLLSPLEVARRKRAYVIYNQIYVGENWIDVVFLEALTTNKNLLLPQSKLSRPILEKLTKTKNKVVKRLIKILNVRCPLYTKLLRNCPKQIIKKQQTQSYLFRVQNQVHRTTLQILTKMRYLRQKGKLQALKVFVEEIMGDYVVLKTRRVMPWKFEFLQEVYDLLALAYADQYNIPVDIMSLNQNVRLITLLKLKGLSDNEPLAYQFGNRATFQEEGYGDQRAALDKAYLARLMKRLHFSKYPIEKSYLWHEISMLSLKKHNTDRCCLDAKKSIDEAEKCNSHLWRLHGAILTLKAHALMNKVEKIALTLFNAKKIARQLRSNEILQFLTLATNFNRCDIKAKKAAAALRASKSRASIASKSSKNTDTE